MAFQSFASERFWQLYRELPAEVQRLADKQYELFRRDPFPPSLHLKQVDDAWTARIGRSHRVIGYREGNAFYLGLDRLARSVQQAAAEDGMSQAVRCQPTGPKRASDLVPLLGIPLPQDDLDCFGRLRSASYGCWRPDGGIRSAAFAADGALPTTQL